MSMIRRLFSLRQLRRFMAARKAAAAVEFALILPFMLALYVGSIELSDAISVDRRVTVIAGTIGDLVARVDQNFTQSDMNDYFSAAEEIMAPYSVANLKQVVTSVKVDNNGVGTVEWSRASNATARTTGASYTLPPAITTLSKNSWVIVSETAYSYQPLLGMVIQVPVNLYRENFHLPRFGKKINPPT